MTLVSVAEDEAYFGRDAADFTVLVAARLIKMIGAASSHIAMSASALASSYSRFGETDEVVPEVRR